MFGFGMVLAVEIIGRVMGVGHSHAWIAWAITAFALLFSCGIGGSRGIPDRPVCCKDKSGGRAQA